MTRSVREELALAAPSLSCLCVSCVCGSDAVGCTYSHTVCNLYVYVPNPEVCTSVCVCVCARAMVCARAPREARGERIQRRYTIYSRIYYLYMLAAGFVALINLPSCRRLSRGGVCCAD